MTSEDAESQCSRPKNTDLDLSNSKSPKETSPLLEKVPKCLHPVYSIVVLFVGNAFFTATNVIFKLMANLDPFSINVIANGVKALLCLVIIAWNRDPIFPKGYRLLILARGFFGSLHFLIYAFAVKHMPLGEMTIIMTLSPVIAVFLAWLILGEEVQFNDVINLLLSILGILLVVQPSILFGECAGDDPNQNGYPLALTLVILTCFTLAFCYIILRKLKEVSTASVVFAVGVEGALLNLAGCLYTNAVFEANATEYAGCVMVGILSLAYQACITLGTRVESAGLTAILQEVYSVAMAWAAQLLIFGEYPNAVAVTGIGVIGLVIINLACRKLSGNMRANHPLRWFYETICCVPWPCSANVKVQPSPQ